MKTNYHAGLKVLMNLNLEECLKTLGDENKMIEMVVELMDGKAENETEASKILEKNCLI
ncbi:hypothetical protein LCGC14_2852670 [marine sediment metagenome]|uniref:Uncharacterized protein n=1 Tax=marine sediment metagenome TaxID=412755 RepID=A0A0F8V9D6_9ZZZZ